MIDWTQPVYATETGNELFALRHPDGHVFADANGRVMAVNRRTGAAVWVEPNHARFTNTPPVQDWSSKFTLFPDHLDINLGLEVTVRAGLRNGKPFAEVVE